MVTILYCINMAGERMGNVFFKFKIRMKTLRVSRDSVPAEQKHCAPIETVKLVLFIHGCLDIEPIVLKMVIN